MQSWKAPLRKRIRGTSHGNAFKKLMIFWKALLESTLAMVSWNLDLNNDRETVASTPDYILFSLFICRNKSKNLLTSLDPVGHIIRTYSLPNF